MKRLIAIIDDKYQIIAGERRYRASQIAELKHIPAIIVDVDDENAANILICTIAYGLGVDTSEVDLVINFGIPKTI